MVSRTCACCGKEIWIECLKDYQYKYTSKDSATHKSKVNVYCSRSCMKNDLENKKRYRSVRW